MQTIENIPAKPSIYQHQDSYRLENIPECLDILNNGSEDLRLQALQQIERILLRVHNTHGIAWDFGGVLMDGHNKFFIELYTRSLGADLSTDQLIQLWEIIFKSEPIPGVNYDALKIGKATPEQFARHAIEHFNLVFAEVGRTAIEISDQEIANFLTLYYSHYDPKHESREVLQRLHQLGIRQYGLTNNFMAKIEYFLEQHEFDYLQWLIIIVSEKFRASKPDPKIYLSFKQHVFLDQFAQERLGVNLSNQAIEKLWQAVFKQEAEEAHNFVAYQKRRVSRQEVSRYVVEQYKQVLAELGYQPLELNSLVNQWLDFWTTRYERIAEQTIFIDDKVKNLNQAFKHEGILGVHYDANQGQKLVSQPVVKELLEQEHLKQVVRKFRELTAVGNPLGERAKQALEKLLPFRIRHEKLIWQSQLKEHQAIINALSNQQIYALLQKHYVHLYTTHFKLGQLVSCQYNLIHRLAILPEYSYDAARQIILELLETSDLFLDQNQNLYPWQKTEMPEVVNRDLKDIQESESILKKKLLPEIKRKIVEYVSVLDISSQPSIQNLVKQLQTQTDNIETLKQITGQLLQQIAVFNSTRLVQWQQIEQLFKDLRGTLALSEQGSLGLQEENQNFLSQQLEQLYQQLDQETQQSSTDLLPLQKIITEWEQEIHQIESSYFQQYHRWKNLNEQGKVALYQDTILEGVRQQFSQEELYQFIRALMLRVYDLPRWKDLTKPTIILVSGASGSGKSTLSQHLAGTFGIRKAFSTDEAGRANTKAILDFLFGEEEAAIAFAGLYQSSFEGSLQSYYYQAILTMIGVEGLIKRLHKQNTSALLEGVGLMPGLLSESIFELLNLDWLVVQIDAQQHYQHFALRAQAATQRNAHRYQANFEMIRRIHEQLTMMGLKHELTMIDNSGSIEQARQIATERIKGPVTSQFIEVHDPIREQIQELLEKQKRHLPIKVRFDLKRAALNLGIAEDSIVELLHRFGFEEMPDLRHQWIQQPLRDCDLI